MDAATTIRPARPADAVPIARMSRDLIECGLGWSWQARRVLHSIDDATTNVVVATLGAAHVGFGIMKYHEDEAHLLLLAVSPASGRQRIGSALVGWLETSARAAGIGQVYLEARVGNAAARSFYRHLGYREIQLRPGYYQGLEASVRLAKDLWVEQSASA